MKRAIGGVRVSGDRQVKLGFGLPEQEAAVQAYCQTRGYELVEIIRDEGESGTLKQRPGLLAMIERARSGAADVVVYPKIDRLGRDALLILQTLEYIRSQGIPVEYADYQIDVSTPSGRLQEVIMAGFAGYELDLITQRMQAGREGKARSGKPPITLRGLGFRSVSVAQARALPEYEGRDGEVQLVEAEAGLVREIFQRYAAGELSLRGIARSLNERGHRTVRNGHFSMTAVRDILTNPLYRGELRWPVHRIRSLEGPDGRKRRQITPVPASEQYVYPVPAIIEAGLWQRAQERLALNREVLAGRPPAQSYLLSGILFCDVCRSRQGHPRRCTGGIHGASGGRRREYYSCASRAREDIAWCGARARCGPLEAATYEFALQACTEGHLGRLARERHLAKQQSAGAALETLEKLRAALRETTVQEGRVADLILAGLCREVVTARVQDIQSRQAALRREIQQLEREVGDGISPAAAERQVEEQAALWRKELSEARDDPQRLQPVYAAMLRVYLHPERKRPRFDLLIG